MKKSKIKKGISVVIPTFNRSSYLYATLLCLCNQKLNPEIDYEVIVIDSGNDDSWNIIQQFMMKFPNIFRGEK